MSETVIKAEGIGKKYIIGHQGKGGYKTFRDQIGDGVKAVFFKTKKMLSGQMVVEGDEMEDFWALKNVGFEIKQGDRVGIIGKNGAGKSTLLKILSRITEPTTGNVLIKGRIASLLEVGTGFHPELSGRENIYLNGAILGMSRAEIKRKFDEIVDFSGVEKFLDTPVKRFSSGMYVRLAFAVAAHLEPEILVVDEVLAVGDAEFQKKCLGKMRDVSSKEGRTIIFVSHQMAAISKLCNRGIFLKAGLKIFDGDIANCIDLYYEESNEKTGVYIFSPTSNDPSITKVTLRKNDDFTVTATKFFHDEEIILDIEYLKNSGSNFLTIGMALLDNERNKLFTSHFDVIESHKHFGKVICRLPKDVLNQGTYSFDIAIFQKGGVVYNYHENICQFELIDKGSELYYQAGEKIGPFRVDCKWNKQ
jgi:lipopolysaccharide transport system ATP-binding protein